MNVTDASKADPSSSHGTQKLDPSSAELLPNSQPLLPRSAWASQVSYLRVLFKVKKRLDQIEAQGLTHQ
jgi:hypothetical protein